MNYRGVSIIVPIYNENSEILEQSFKSISNQTYKNFEVLLIDDSTNFNTSVFCQNYVKYDHRFKHTKNNERLGLPASLNLGIQQSKFDLICRFDADDICDENRIYKQVTYLKEHPNVDVLGGAVETFYDNKLLGVKIYPKGFKQIKLHIQFYCPIAHPTVIFKKQLFYKFGGYNENMSNSEDLDLWIRWLNNGVIFENLRDILIKYRVPKYSIKRNSKHYKSVIYSRYVNMSLLSYPFKYFGIFLIVIYSFLPKKVINILRKHPINETH